MRRETQAKEATLFLFSTKKGLFCKPSLTRTILPLQDDLKVLLSRSFPN
ncbi:unnamed protein product [Brassica rapa subsp. trilocularis]